jgi:hypothetical protein
VVSTGRMPAPAPSLVLPPWIGPIFGVIVGFLLSTVSRVFDEAWFGPKLVIDCQHAPRNREEANDKLYVRFRVRNLNKRRMAKQCYAYIVGLHKMTDGKEVSENLLADSFQLPWAGYSFEPKNIPFAVSQYADLVQFPKNSPPGWIVLVNPTFYASLDHLKGYQGTCRFSVVVAADGAVTKTAYINVEYRNDWHNVAIYE